MAETQTEPRYCQTCIELGVNPPREATREWQVGIYHCEEHFNDKLNSLTSPGLADKPIKKDIDSKFESGPVLQYIYDLYQIPKELQFDSVDEVCRNYDKFFNFHAPAVINRSLESLSLEIEQLAMSMFIIKFRNEPLTMQIGKLKEKRREEKGLKNYVDSKETYAKGKPKSVKETDEEKLAKKLGMSVGDYREMVKKARERDFNKIAGNCPECGGAMPCKEHKSNG